MKGIIVLVALLAVSAVPKLMGQAGSYIITKDSRKIIVGLSFLPSDPTTVQQKMGSSGTKTVSAENCEELLLEDGRRFVSREIDLMGRSKAVFLQVLLEDSISLYRLIGYEAQEELFFLETNNRMTLLEADRLQEQLAKYLTSCADGKRMLQSVRYKRLSLQAFIQNIIEAQCVALPFLSYGIGVNINSVIHKGERNISGVYKASSTHWNIGAFVHTPVWSVKNLGLTVEVTIGGHGFTGKTSGSGLEEDFYVEVIAANGQIAATYTLGRTQKVAYYGLMGVDVMLNYTSHSSLFSTQYLDDRIAHQSWVDEEVTLNTGTGPVLGSGIRYFYTPSKYVALEGHVAALLGSESTSFIQLSIGLKANL